MHRARHAVPRRTGRKVLLAAAAASLLTGGGLAIAGSASAASSYSISFSTTGAGNTAGWTTTAEKSVTLHVENASSGSNAVINVNGFTAGDALPTTAPTFDVSSGYASGTPRLEIEAGNGTYEAAYPASVCGATAPAVCWANPVPGQGTTYDATYAQVRDYVDSNGGIKSAFVVADTSQALPYSAVVDELSWGGQQLVPGTLSVTAPGPTAGEVSSFTNYSASCLDNSGFKWDDGNPLQLWKCGAAGGEDQQFELTTVDNYQVLEAVAPSGQPQGPWCVTAPSGNGRLTIATCNPGGPLAQNVRVLNGAGTCKCGVFYQFVATGKVIDDSAYDVQNGAPVIAYTYNGGRNQAWSRP
jgi:hypothetical protein